MHKHSNNEYNNNNNERNDKKDNDSEANENEDSCIQGLFINDVRERERDVSEIGSSHNKKLFGGGFQNQKQCQNIPGRTSKCFTPP